jgi:hypothetical protein
MRAQVTLRSEESKRLIAKGVAELPSVKKAMADHTIVIVGGTTNGFVAEELSGEKIGRITAYTIGIITDGVTTLSDEEGRIPPYVITKGKVRDRDYHWKDYMKEIKAGDVFIKGANALDHTGMVAVLASNNTGGTIGGVWGTLTQRNVEIVAPVGLEKLIPDVRDAVEFMKGKAIDEAMGDKVGLMPVIGATVVTEITALKLLYNVEARCIAAGGIGNTQGAVTLVMDGEEDDVKKAMALIRQIKGL